MLQRIVESKSKTLLAFCFSFLGGVALASLFVSSRIDFVYFYFAFFTLAGLLQVFWKHRTGRFFLFVSLFALFGVFRYASAFPSFHDIAEENGQSIALEGFIAEEPDVRVGEARYIVEIKTVQSETQTDSLSGRVYVKAPQYPEYAYGDRVRLRCDLEAPEAFDDFRYDMYLARLGVFSICEHPHVQKIGDGGGNTYMARLLMVKSYIANRITLLWSEPYASFMAGLLYGYRGGLGERLAEDFNRTGVTHILAISGYNISLIATVIMGLCIRLWIPRKQAFWLVTLGLIIFVFFAGAGASVIRAGIMGFLVILARQLGRMSRVGNALALSAALMTLHNPFILLWDVGFQLSFIATLGLVYLAPLFETLLESLPTFLNVKQMLAQTFSAIIATLPLMLYQFGRLSLIAPIVNILVLPAVPIIMAFGFFTLLFSFVPWMSQLLAWCSYIGMGYVIAVVTWFSELPFAVLDITIPWWGMAFGYVGIAFLWHHLSLRLTCPCDILGEV